MASIGKSGKAGAIWLQTRRRPPAASATPPARFATSDEAIAPASAATIPDCLLRPRVICSLPTVAPTWSDSPWRPNVVSIAAATEHPAYARVGPDPPPHARLHAVSSPTDPDVASVRPP